MNIYVGNLAPEVTEAELMEHYKLRYKKAHRLANTIERVVKGRP